MRCSILFVVIVACGDGRPGASSPDEVYRRFVNTMSAGDYAAAFDLMAPGYRERWVASWVKGAPAIASAIPQLKEHVDEETRKLTPTGRSPG